MLPAPLDAIHLSVLPMAIGRNHRPVYEGDKLFDTKVSGIGYLVNSVNLMSLVQISKIKTCTAIRFVSKILGSTLSGAAPYLLERDIITLLIEFSND